MSENETSTQAGAGTPEAKWWTDYVNAEGFPCGITISGQDLAAVMHTAAAAIAGIQKAGGVPYFRYSYGKGNGHAKEGEAVHGRAPGAQPLAQPAPAAAAQAATPPQGGPAGQPQATWINGVPHCPYHQDRRGGPRAMARSTVYEGWFCKGKNADGTYCKFELRDS